MIQVQTDGLTVYVYQLKKGEENVSVEKVSFKKSVATTQ